VTVVVECEIDEPVRGPSNPLEIAEVRLFGSHEVPRSLAMGMTDMLRAAMQGGPPVLE
jgi:hypothetical protein